MRKLERCAFSAALIGRPRLYSHLRSLWKVHYPGVSWLEHARPAYNRMTIGSIAIKGAHGWRTSVVVSTHVFGVFTPTCTVLQVQLSIWLPDKNQPPLGACRRPTGQTSHKHAIAWRVAVLPLEVSWLESNDQEDCVLRGTSAQMAPFEKDLEAYSVTIPPGRVQPLIERIGPLGHRIC